MVRQGDQTPRDFEVCNVKATQSTRYVPTSSAACSSRNLQQRWHLIFPLIPMAPKPQHPPGAVTQTEPLSFPITNYSQNWGFEGWKLSLWWLHGYFCLFFFLIFFSPHYLLNYNYFSCIFFQVTISKWVGAELELPVGAWRHQALLSTRTLRVNNKQELVFFDFFFPPRKTQPVTSQEISQMQNLGHVMETSFKNSHYCSVLEDNTVLADPYKSNFLPASPHLLAKWMKVDQNIQT